MSNKSRARYADEARRERAEVEAIPAEEQEQMDAVLKAYETMEKDGKKGLSEWAKLLLADRDKQLKEPTAAVPDTTKRYVDPDAIGIREPTAYERSILIALGNRKAMVGMQGGHRCPTAMPVEIVSGGVYGGTVEDARVAQRRAKNRRARAARSGRTLRTRGHVLHSRFGYTIRIPGITRDDVVDAEIVEDDE